MSYGCIVLLPGKSHYQDSLLGVKITGQVKHVHFDESDQTDYIPVSILHKSIAGRSRPVRVADGPITARCRFIKNASLDMIVFLKRYSLVHCSLFICRYELDRFV